MNEVISKTQELFNKILSQIPKKEKRFKKLSMLVAAAISSAIKNDDKSQKWLADQLNHKESQISKWLAGNHNFTIRTIAEIESVLDVDIITVNYKNERKAAIHTQISPSYDAESFNCDIWQTKTKEVTDKRPILKLYTGSYKPKTFETNPSIKNNNIFEDSWGKVV
jgi:hypothetical protein